MIARITKFLIFLQLSSVGILSAVAVRLWGIQYLWPALMLSIAIVFLIRLLITASGFSLARRYASEPPAALHLNWRQACHLFFEEFSASMLSSSWTMPFYSFSQWISSKPVGLPVLLIHGYGCNSGYWRAISNTLKKNEISHRAVDLEPMWGAIESYSAIIAHAVNTLSQETGSKRIIILAHSMGGLATRVYLRDYGNTRVAKIITLGTPHHGTALARFSPGLNCKQMRWVDDATHGGPSDWLRRLEKTENMADRSLFISIYSHHDNIVSPQTSSQLPDATNIAFHGIGHVALGFNPLVRARITEEILQTTDFAISSG